MNDPHSDHETRVGMFQIAVLVLTVLILGALVADTIFALPKHVSSLIQSVDTIICGVFVLEFGVRFHRAESKLAFLKWGWIDLVASIPNIDVLRLGRLARVLRIIRLLRGIRSVQKVLTLFWQNKVESGLVSVGLTVFLLVAFSSVSILICERHPEANIKTAEDAVWWSISTITTVGYGDRYPVTTEGRILGMALMIAGVGLFGGLSGLAASFFLGDHEKHTRENKEILERLDLLQQKIDALRGDGQKRE